jgi:hypothetical protein
MTQRQERIQDDRIRLTPEIVNKVSDTTAGQISFSTVLRGVEPISNERWNRLVLDFLAKDLVPTYRPLRRAPSCQLRASGERSAETSSDDAA